MSPKPKNPAAFPGAFVHPHDRFEPEFQQGMMLRDYFAAKAMQGMVSSIDSEETYTRFVDIAHQNNCERVSEWIAKDAYKQADAMLAERERS